MIPVETAEQSLRSQSLDATLRLFEALLHSPKITPKTEISEVEVLKVAQLFYAYLKGDEDKSGA
jgi:hypothetical protein